MKVAESQGAQLHWITRDHKGDKWFECKLNLIDFSIEKTSHEKRARYIQSLIKSAAQLNSDFLSKWKKYKVTCEMGFDPEWGLGSSSTLIVNLADWAELSPFELFFDTQNGSGYDIAAAMTDEPFLYQKSEDELTFETFEWDQKLMESMYVFYEGQKQSSFEEVNAWKKNKNWRKKDVSRISSISEALADCQKVDEAVSLLKEHIHLMESILERKAYEGQFKDFEGVVKPLGAWGGDFGLVLHQDEEYIQRYLQQKGIKDVFRLQDIVFE